MKTRIIFCGFFLFAFFVLFFNGCSSQNIVQKDFSAPQSLPDALKSLNLQKLPNTDENVSLDMESKSESKPIINVQFIQTSPGEPTYLFETIGRQTELLSKEYTVISPYSYVSYPIYLITQKGNELVSFNIDWTEFHSIFGDTDEDLIQEGEEVYVFPSISDKSKFYFLINTYTLGSLDQMGLPYSERTRAYFYDAISQKLVEAKTFPIEVPRRFCMRYDSMKLRFLRWRCGEGAGSLGPVEILNFEGDVIGTLVNISSQIVFFLREFLWVERMDKDATLYVLHPLWPDDGIQIFRDKRLNNKGFYDGPLREDSRLMALNEDSKTIIINSKPLTLLRYDENGIIVDEKVFDVMLNNFFINYEEGPHLYYVSGGLYELDLVTWQEESLGYESMWEKYPNEDAILWDRS